MRQFALIASCLTAGILAGCNSATPPTAPDATPVAPAAGMTPPAGSGVTGGFVGAGGHRGSGGVRFAVANGVGRLDFGDDFSVQGVPGPFVYVNTTNNANTGRPLRVAALKSNSGAQSYVFEVPPGVSYTWILVWCDPFNVPVAEASIPATP
ncbi:MAG: DM13 domain-containing protein [Gemmatimonadaceae bacterium]|nr:DM13 domain-containing protein [Gemmatimonadaceae bacterium]